MIVFGRFIAYNWYECGKPQPAFVNWFAECAASPTGIIVDEEAAPEGQSASVEATMQGGR